MAKEQTIYTCNECGGIVEGGVAVAGLALGVCLWLGTPMRRWPCC